MEEAIDPGSMAGSMGADRMVYDRVVSYTCEWIKHKQYIIIINPGTMPGFIHHPLFSFYALELVFDLWRIVIATLLQQFYWEICI